MTDTTKDAALRLCDEVIAERDALKAQGERLARLVMESKESRPKSENNRVFLDYRDWEAIKAEARALLADRRTAGGNP